MSEEELKDMREYYTYFSDDKKRNKVVDYIEQLQQENEYLKESRPIENRAEHILNELESWLEEYRGTQLWAGEILGKLYELKGSDE